DFLAVVRAPDHVGEGAPPIDPEAPAAVGRPVQNLTLGCDCHRLAAHLRLAHSEMSFWRKIAGLAVRKVDEAECDVCPPGLPGEDPAFSTAVTALGAKLAKADGEAHAAEYETFHAIFQAEAGSEGAIRRLYQLARQTTRGFEGYARRLRKRYGACPQLLEDVLDGLFHIAASDGVVASDELTYLARVRELLGQSPLTFRRLAATH